MCFRWLPIERKIYFLRSCPFGVFSSASTWGYKIFSIIFKILWQWKLGGCIYRKHMTVKSRWLSFGWFRRLLLRRTFNFLRKIFPKSQQRIVGEWKQCVNFLGKGCFLTILAAYLLRGYFIAGQIQRFRFGILVRRSRVSNWDTDVWSNHWTVWIDNLNTAPTNT